MTLLARFRRKRPLSCHQVGEVLQTYLDRELDETTTRRVAEHLEACRRCGLEAEVYDQLKVALAQGSLGVPAEPVARLREFGARLASGAIDPDELDPG